MKCDNPCFARLKRNPFVPFQFLHGSYDGANQVLDIELNGLFAVILTGICHRYSCGERMPRTEGRGAQRKFAIGKFCITQPITEREAGVVGQIDIRRDIIKVTIIPGGAAGGKMIVIDRDLSFCPGKTYW